jgi:hypothetical protein
MIKRTILFVAVLLLLDTLTGSLFAGSLEIQASESSGGACDRECLKG